MNFIKKYWKECIAGMMFLGGFLLIMGNYQQVALLNGDVVTLGVGTQKLIEGVGQIGQAACLVIYQGCNGISPAMEVIEGNKIYRCCFWGLILVSIVYYTRTRHHQTQKKSVWTFIIRIGVIAFIVIMFVSEFVLLMGSDPTATTQIVSEQTEPTPYDYVGYIAEGAAEISYGVACYLAVITSALLMFPQFMVNRPVIAGTIMVCLSATYFVYSIKMHFQAR